MSIKTLSGSTLLSCLILAGCTQHQAVTPLTKSSEIIPIEGRYTAELSERYGYPLATDEDTAHTLLTQLADEANKRYRSAAPVDKADLKLTGITLSIGNHDYRMRDINAVVSRGDSRVLKTSDLQVKYSGISTDLRVTYSLNGLIFINGQAIGQYNPSESNYLDARIEDLKGQGAVYLRAAY